MRLFIAGGSGKIGARLLPLLKQRGDQVILLTRNRPRAEEKLGAGPEYIEGDAMHPGFWMDRINGCDGVINLVGEFIFARRWTELFKQLLRDSRVQSTANIVAAIQRAAQKPRVLVQGSAIGYYGYHGDEQITESSPPGDDFLARVCVEWENTAKPVIDMGVRLAVVRTGVVLDPEGGALASMMRPFQFLMGGPVGDGKQWVSWVHHADDVGILLHALDNDQVSGPINATAPTPVTNADLAKALGKAMHRPSFMPTPAFMLRLALGEVADLVTKGQRVLPARALALGYGFQYPDIDSALHHLVGKRGAA